MQAVSSLRRLKKASLKKKSFAYRFASDSSARFQSRSWSRPLRGMSGTRVGTFLAWEFPGCRKKSPRTKSLLLPSRRLRPSSVPTQPLSNESWTVFCILGNRSLASPAPIPFQSGEQQANAIKGARERAWPSLAKRSDAGEFLEKKAA